MICCASYADRSRVDSQVTVEHASVQPLTLSALVETLSGIAGATVQATDFVYGKGLISVHISEPTVVIPARPFKSVIIQPFNHSQEGELVEVARNVSTETELWITAVTMPLVSGLWASHPASLRSLPDYKVYSVLFEDHLLVEAAREKVMHDLRHNTLLLK